MSQSRGITVPLGWSVIVCPLVGLVAALVVRGSGATLGVLVFIGVPFLLSAVGLIWMLRSAVDIIVLSALASVTSGLVWFLIFSALAGQGVYDT